MTKHPGMWTITVQKWSESYNSYRLDNTKCTSDGQVHYIRSRDAGRSKLLSWGARCDHLKTSISIYQKKALGELYWALPLSSCAFNVCVSYAHFHFFPNKFRLNENAKALCLYCIDSIGKNISVKAIQWDKLWYDFPVFITESKLFLSKRSILRVWKSYSLNSYHRYETRWDEDHTLLVWTSYRCFCCVWHLYSLHAFPYMSVICLTIWLIIQWYKKASAMLYKVFSFVL